MHRLVASYLGYKAPAGSAPAGQQQEAISVDEDVTPLVFEAGGFPVHTGARMVDTSAWDEMMASRVAGKPESGNG